MQIEALLSMPEAVSVPDRYRDLMKEYNALSPIVESYRAYARLCDEISSALLVCEDASEDDELREDEVEEEIAID